MRLSTVVLDAPNAPELADFYRRLLDWTVVAEEPEWVLLHRPAARVAPGTLVGRAWGSRASGAFARAVTQPFGRGDGDALGRKPNVPMAAASRTT